MNDQNQQDHPIAPTILPAKRRRGRPQRDEGPAKRMILQTPTTPAPEMSQKDSTDDHNNMLGQVVSGVIDGSFDAGYFLSINIGNSATTLRGLVFEPGRFSPITAANDIAPQVKMHHRSQVVTLQDQLHVSPAQVLPSEPLPNSASVHNDQRANQDQMIKNQSQFTPLLENLRMVEQDEVMEAFEVANQAVGLELNASEQGKCSKGENQLMNSIVQPGTLVYPNLNSSNDKIHHSNVVDGTQEMGSDQKQVESEAEKNSSNRGTLLQPSELVHSELKKLEIHRAPSIDAQTQLIPTINPELQLGNQDCQPHQTTPFVELDSVAQESVAAESEVHHYVDMPKHNVTSDTQVLHQESISYQRDFAMERRNSPYIKEQQSTDVGTEVKVVGKEETSHERE
ncbi:hypothetical protein P3S68_003272 [Capsicum galapagoense]